MTFQPLFMREVNLILGDVLAGGADFQCQLRSVTLTPDVTVTKVKTLCPDGQFADVDVPEWNLTLGYLYGTATTPDTALADYLLTHSGEKSDFEFRPVAGGAGYTGTVTLLPGPIGGDQGAFSEQSVDLPVDGQPVPVAAAGG